MIEPNGQSKWMFTSFKKNVDGKITVVMFGFAFFGDGHFREKWGQHLDMEIFLC